jgi:hypothetical protein
MTSFASLFACAAVDVTYDRVRALVEEQPPESLTLEFKSQYSEGVPKSIAAMANSYGGLIVIGVADSGVERLLGVPPEAITQVANGCHERLEPPWEPEIISVPVPDKGGMFLLVVRVDPSRAPRPVMVGGTVPIRLNGRNATADRSRVAQLFTESAPIVRTAGRRLPAPTLLTESDGGSTVDFILRTGMWIPVDVTATWRPLSERAVDRLAEALNASPMARRLLRWSGDLGCSSLNPFHRTGFNRARHARLAWQAVASSPSTHPVEAVLEADLPDAYGVTTSTMQVTLDVLVRARALMKNVGQTPADWRWRLDVPSLYTTIDALLEAFTTQPVIDALAGLAGIDPILVPAPATLDFRTHEPVDQLLNPYRLTVIPDAGGSHGATLLADPSRNLAHLDQRRAQVDDWLRQIALDAGLHGMEDLLVEVHAPDGAKGGA